MRVVIPLPLTADNMASNDRPHKKRKKDTQNITIGGKVISLEGYLAPAPKAEEQAPTHASTLAAQATSTSEGHSTSPHTEAKRHPKSSKRDKEGEAAGGKEAGCGNARLLKSRQQLPIWQHQSEIRTALNDLKKNSVVVIVGETGSGKSTQVPQFLYRESWCQRRKVKIQGSQDEMYVGGTIAITQPRRVAATTLAHRVSQEVDTPLGKGRNEGLVGYSVRFDRVIPRGTKIKFLTEGMLLQELLRDPHLRQYSAVIVDEIHERSLDVDLLTGFLKQILEGNMQGRGGVPLKVVVMSATVDVDAIGRFFTPKSKEQDVSLQVLRIKGRQFPVKVLHEPRPVPDIQNALLKAITAIHQHEPLPGDILAFLTGQEEIEAAQKLIEEYASGLASNMPKIKAVPLYGQMSIEAQREAFRPVNADLTRKIILATNIAETSVTVPGVRFVIDCGKAKMKQFRSRLGMESLLAKPISKSSALQRTGRAGREGPGICYRLYTEEAFGTLAEADLPEILRNDVLGAVLTMKARGIKDVTVFPLMDAPDTEAIEKALVHLLFLGALNDDGTVTVTGEKMARFPVPATLGAVLLAASKPEFDCVLDVIDAISCITSGEDIFLQLHSEEAQEAAVEARKELQRREGDIITYVTTIQRYTAENADRTDWCKHRKINIRNIKQALNIRRQLRAMCVKEKLLTETPPNDPQPFVPLSPERATLIIQCFLRGFALKSAMLAPDGRYVTVQGKHAVAIHPSSVLHGQKKEAIMFLDHVFTNKSYAKKVSSIQAVWIAEALENR